MSNKPSQTELEDSLGISKSSFSMILSGKRKRPTELLDKISSQIPVNIEADLPLRGRCP